MINRCAKNHGRLNKCKGCNYIPFPEYRIHKFQKPAEVPKFISVVKNDFNILERGVSLLRTPFAKTLQKVQTFWRLIT